MFKTAHLWAHEVAVTDAADALVESAHAQMAAAGQEHLMTYL